jgi:hypothetical protein
MQLSIKRSAEAGPHSSTEFGMFGGTTTHFICGILSEDGANGRRPTRTAYLSEAEGTCC